MSGSTTGVDSGTQANIDALNQAATDSQAFSVAESVDGEKINENNGVAGLYGKVGQG